MSFISEDRVTSSGSPHDAIQCRQHFWWSVLITPFAFGIGFLPAPSWDHMNGGRHVLEFEFSDWCTLGNQDDTSGGPEAGAKKGANRSTCTRANTMHCLMCCVFFYSTGVTMVRILKIATPLPSNQQGFSSGSQWLPTDLISPRYILIAVCRIKVLPI